MARFRFSSIWLLLVVFVLCCYSDFASAERRVTKIATNMTIDTIDECDNPNLPAVSTVCRITRLWITAETVQPLRAMSLSLSFSPNRPMIFDLYFGYSMENFSISEQEFKQMSGKTPGRLIFSADGESVIDEVCGHTFFRHEDVKKYVGIFTPHDFINARNYDFTYEKSKQWVSQLLGVDKVVVTLELSTGLQGEGSFDLSALALGIESALNEAVAHK